MDRDKLREESFRVLPVELKRKRDSSLRSE
jgi:hypothetical protein